ncbi:hypothetical protein BJX66DRAFT_246195 [Aspergillus keveii]|uniref:Secreted protein n=1 Tax=Aspergillus keveii TaxID=714993 RepID=A0ABR4G0J3_9EURO
MSYACIELLVGYCLCLLPCSSNVSAVIMSCLIHILIHFIGGIRFQHVGNCTCSQHCISVALPFKHILRRVVVDRSG